MNNKELAIHNGNSNASIAPIGGTVATYNIGDQKVFYPWWATETKSRGGCPLCAPWFGKSPRGIKNHGHLRDLTASEKLVSDNKIELGFNGPVSEKYPWALDYRTTAEIGTDGSLNIGLNITHKDDNSSGPAPVLPGFHPYFS